MESSKVFSIETGLHDPSQYRREMIAAVLTSIKNPFKSKQAEFDPEETSRFWFLCDLLERLIEQEVILLEREKLLPE